MVRTAVAAGDDDRFRKMIVVIGLAVALMRAYREFF
jgi:hypothetical protein